MKLTNIKISIRLALAFGLLLVLMVVLGAIGAMGMARIEDRLDKIVTDNNRQAQVVRDMIDAAMEEQRLVRTILLLNMADEIDAEIAQINTARRRYAQARDELSNFAAEESENALRVSLTEAEKAARAEADTVVATVKAQRDQDMVKVVRGKLSEAETRWRGLMNEDLRQVERRNKEEYDSATRAYHAAQFVMIAVVIVSIVIGILMSWQITRSVARPASAAAEVARLVAGGDLTRKVQAKSTDEMGQLLAALETMRTSLTESVQSIRVGAQSVGSASSEIARGNTDLSSRTEEQASSLEETASSMEQITSTVKQNTDNAQRANELAAKASAVAVRGGDAVREVVGTMRAISDSSKKIGDIIGVIDSIAFQTNILALNAAVEAARAGEQGRGFAVVASEVRALAQRSAQAAKEISGLIKNSVTQVAGGAKQVESAGKTMEEIVTSVKSVTDIILEITSASREQLAGIEPVNQAIMQMEGATQQNAAVVEESAAAAENMAAQAQMLIAAVERFKLDNAHRSAEQESPRTIARRSVESLPPVSRSLSQNSAYPALERASPRARTALPHTTVQESDWKEF